MQPHASHDKLRAVLFLKGRKPLLLLAASVVASQLLAVGLTLWAHVVAAADFYPESVLLADTFAPCAAVFVVAWWLGRERNWKIGALFAAIVVACYFAVHLFLTTRWQLEFWRDGWTQLSLSHVGWWFLTINLGGVGAALGARFPRLWSAISVSGAVFVVLAGMQLAESVRRIPDEKIPTDFVIHNFSDHGTTTRLLTFDLSAVRFGVTDADFDDSRPLDDRNATWLGQPLDRVWKRLDGRKNELLCVVNGGFFGAVPPWIGVHEAPLKSSGGAFYESRVLEEDWPDQNVILAWRTRGGRTQPFILHDTSLENLNAFDGALGGVRVLIDDGKLAALKPGMGGTTLKCSRTSVAWKDDQFFVLSVRDPDGEASSVRANNREKAGGAREQVGGWDVAQVQQFWRRLNVSDAVLFDGGESTQIALRRETGVETAHSSYHFTRTLGWWNSRPLRAVWPMLPPSQANGGVLNWFFVSAR